MGKESFIISCSASASLSVLNEAIRTLDSDQRKAICSTILRRHVPDRARDTGRASSRRSSAAPVGAGWASGSLQPAPPMTLLRNKTWPLPGAVLPTEVSSTSCPLINYTINQTDMQLHQVNIQYICTFLVYQLVVSFICLSL